MVPPTFVFGDKYDNLLQYRNNIQAIKITNIIRIVSYTLFGEKFTGSLFTKYVIDWNDNFSQSGFKK